MTKKAIPNDKTTREPNQDDFKTVLDSQGPSKPQFGVTPGAPFGRPNRHQNGTKNDAKTKRKFKSQKTDPRRSWTRLGAILGRFGCSLGALETLQTLRLPMFREKSLFRC